MPLRLAFAVVFLFCTGWLSAQDMSPQKCGECHESQFETWLDAKHNARGIVCAACHGPFHSGTLNGCKACHTGEHNVQFKDWQFVKDYMVEGDTSDYYCIVCHNPHNPKVAKVLLCTSCHGPDKPPVQPRKTFHASVQSAHNAFASVAPKMNDDSWNKMIKSTGGKVLIGSSVVIIAGVLIFPYLYTGFAFVRWIKRKLTRRKP
jgi:Cytochrome c3